MNQKDLCEHTRIHLIAAAVGHQQCTKTESTLIPLPGTKKFIAIGTLPAIAKVLMVEPPASTPPSTAPAPQTDPQQSESIDKDRQFHRLLADFGAARFGDVPTARERLIAYIDSHAKAAQAAPLLSELSVDLLDDLWQGMRTYHGGEPFKMGHLEFARAIEREVKAAQAAPSAPTDAIALLQRMLDNDFGKSGWPTVWEVEQCIAASKAAPSAKAEPAGWLYDWTHSSALGKPDEHFTSFTVDREQAFKHGHENQRLVYAAPAPAVQAEDVRNQALEDLLTRIDGAHENYERFGEVCVFEGEPMIHASTLVEIAALRESLRTPSTSQTSEQQGGEA